MDETYGLKAITLFCQPFREYDSKITLFSREKGKQELVARGTKRLKSKLAGHLEPFNMVEVMAIKGRTCDYIGAAISVSCHNNIKSDLLKIKAASRAVKAFNQATKLEAPDQALYYLLKNFLTITNQDKIDTDKIDFLTDLFLYKFICLSGCQPELSICLACGKRIEPKENFIDIPNGGLICGDCGRGGLTISCDCLKIFRLALLVDFDQLVKIKTEKKLRQDVKQLVCSFFEYHLTSNNITGG